MFTLQFYFLIVFKAVRKSRDKAKKKADETMKRVKKLREDNKMLEGKIDEQKKTKKFLKELFIQQTTSSSRMEKPTKEVRIVTHHELFLYIIIFLCTFSNGT